MTTGEIHLELLLGKQVLDSAGQPVGRIEEVRAAQQGEEWVIQEYLVGPVAILERLSAWAIGLSLLRLLGARKFHHGGYRIPWDKLDLTNVEHPCLRCTLQELEEINHQMEHTQQPQTEPHNSKNCQ